MAPGRTCEHCGQTLDPMVRADARFCSTRCRVAAHRAGSCPIPAALRSRERWVRHADKRPVMVDGWPASSTDPRTWTSYDAVVASTTGDGIGFVLDGDGIACIDLDHCLEGGRLLPWAERLLADAPATYVEVSPSGSGLHVWGLAEVARGRRLRIDGGDVEIYGSARYLTVTGKRFAGAPASLAPIGDLVASLARRVSSPEEV